MKPDAVRANREAASLIVNQEKLHLSPSANVTRHSHFSVEIVTRP